MIRRIGLLGALTGAAGLLFAAPGTAGAATTLGETFVPPDAFTEVSIALQAQSPGNAYAAPSPGVITSWSFQASFGALPQGLKLKVGRPAGGADFTIVGESAPKNPISNQLNTYTDVSIPVQTGDVIGLYPGDVDNDAHFFRSVDESKGFGAVVHVGDLAPGGTDDFEGPVSVYQLDVSAKLEPDADHDGFGDETQDQCATNASTQGACSASPTPTPHKKKCKKKHKKRSAAEAKAKKCKKKKRR
jgi:hypothetical protein